MFFLFVLTGVAVADEFTIIDGVSDAGRYAEALELIMNKFDQSSPAAAILWRIGREHFNVAESLPKREAIAKLDQGIAFIDRYINSATGTPRDRATLIYWRTVLFSQRSKLIGIFESLGGVPQIFENCLRAVALDPTFGDPYYLMAVVDNAIPAIVGDAAKRGENSKHRMGVNFIKAIERDPQNMFYLVDGAYGFFNRNWNIDTKNRNNETVGFSDGTPANLDDRAFARTLANRAIAVYNGLQTPTVKQTRLYNLARELLTKL